MSDYEMDSVGQSVPEGVITMWSGSINEIPDGWTLCDGTDGAPDLTNRFVVGAGTSVNHYDVGDTGGQDEVQLTVDEMPSHSHESNAADGPVSKQSVVNRGVGA